MNKILMNPQDKEYRREEANGDHMVYPARNLGLPRQSITASFFMRLTSLPIDPTLWSSLVVGYYE